MAFGADQLELDAHSRPWGAKPRWSFFNVYFFGLELAKLTAATAVVYVQENVGWGWGLGILRNVEYSILLVMSELSTMRCARALGLWLQVHGRRVSTESCRGGAVADEPCGGRR